MQDLKRSISAVIVGFGATVSVFYGVGIALERFTSAGVVPWHSPQVDTPGFLLIASGRLFISLLTGAFAASWVARGREMWHAIAFGALMLLLALFDGAPPESIQPLWFTVAQLVMLVPAAMCGGLVVLLVRRRTGSELGGG